MLPKQRRPTPPGEVLEMEFMAPMGITQKQLANDLGITRVRVNEIIRGRRTITPDTAFRLARYFGTTVEFWLGLQMDVSAWDTFQEHATEYERINPVQSEAPMGTEVDGLE